MNLASGFCAITLALVAASSVAVDHNHGEAAAEVVAGAWLSLVDARNYAGSWTAAATRFRQAIPKQEWESKAARVRAPLGELRSRKLQSATFSNTLPGAPDGEYVVIRFESSFEHKAVAVETVTPVKDEDGTWRVAGYYIR